MITAGIDIGSVATKVTLLRRGEPLARGAQPTGVDPRATCKAVFESALAQAGIAADSVERIVATGYGRYSVDNASRVVTEITCAAWGARSVACAPPRAIIDIGGQDTKAILLEPDGRVRDFAMNDKCAAGTGRFLEVMARILEVPLDRLGQLSIQSTAPVAINATCTVFAESEVISLLHAGAAPADIIAGLHNAVAARVAAMIPRLQDAASILFIGGGARNAGLRQALQDTLGAPVLSPPEPEFVVSRGAALIAAEG